MPALRLLVNGPVTGSALGLAAIGFSPIYSTTKIFHVAHAGVYTTDGLFFMYWVQGTFPSRGGVPGHDAGCGSEPRLFSSSDCPARSPGGPRLS